MALSGGLVKTEYAADIGDHAGGAGDDLGRVEASERLLRLSAESSAPEAEGANDEPVLRSTIGRGSSSVG